MIANTAVRNIIRDQRTFELQNVMQLCSSEGMRTFDEALANLVKGRLVSAENALIKSSNPQQLKAKLGFEFEAAMRVR
jgi:twitching motility protein PilT